jgi:pyruvate dehydrogenase E1 component beta subunit
MGVPGVKLAVPSSPFDAKGLLISAIRDNNPVLFFEHKLLYNVNKFKGKVEDYVHQDVPEEDYEIPFGKAEIKRRGKDVTVVATHLMLHRSLEAADLLHKEGIQVEVIDPRTLVPLDINMVTKSVRKTGKLVVAHESPKTGGWAGEFISSVCEITEGNCKVKRVATHDVPIPYAPVLEDYAVPGMERIKAEIKNILK